MIKDFYHGNIIRSEHKCLNPEYRQVTQQWLKLADEFKKVLTPEQLELFNQLLDMEGKYSEIASEDLYETGFRDGARLMLDILEYKD